MTTNVFAKSPELRDWAVEGHGASQVDLGLLLRSLTPNKKHPDYFRTNRPILPVSELADSEHFMLPHLTDSAKRRIVAVAALKANLLSFFESNPIFVSLYQKYVEKYMGLIVKNK